MEKDYFKDRSNECKLVNSINIGDTVYICEKSMQRSASKIEDLTFGVVVRKLTKHDHPRGIKVEIKSNDGRVSIGRVVYLVRNGKIIYGKRT
ncbi:MAG: YwbE family protein [Clostridium sp.]|jgi:uncharacterized repeat protein (TIGR03833 family)|uniref:DUF2196 domain-containing protein n=1 Tax=Clostridium sp. TaxID=1506 RepID=UPI0025C44AA2|nr:DUF2196 domain-containing protein [Clostridium sp.]MCH3963650.1 YwbE family protein [Clostridium sp.]MCI1714791.1 YwbE family protein [Clostridium sp.]MCI1799020.1 YwbE family protein [Clostridium sp.]MCI1812974.1 YwbE family protein [Clostridium sp.]MCI1869864.1 YwbE family protein [Clostridium sp.]